jgi:hypothetical protein
MSVNKGNSSSDDILRDALATAIGHAQRTYQKHPERFDGDDWWQLSAAEIVVFDIDPERWPRLMTAWHWYEGFSDMASGGDWDDAAIEAARISSADLLTISDQLRQWMKFALRFAAIQPMEAVATHGKMHWWTVRQGYVSYSTDEPGAGKRHPF